MIQSAVVFFNADYLKRRLLKIARAGGGANHCLLIEASAVNMLDSTAIAMLEELRTELAAHGITLYLSELNSRARKALLRSDFAEQLGEGTLFATTEAAIAAHLARGDTPSPLPTN